MDSEEYKEVFPTRLQEDSQAAGRWQTAQGGEYFAVGVEVRHYRSWCRFINY